jgi:phage shock protein PspC (stress-responsive transcriptional regulator)
VSESDSKINVEQTAREIWATRPYRPAADGKIGGVAAAIGHRYDIDPVLVRVAFVVATVFSGVGVLLYLLGWLLLPAEGDETSGAESLLGRGRSSMSSAMTLVLGIALIPAAGFAFGDAVSGAIGLTVVAGALFMLHRSRSELGHVPAPAAPGTAAATGMPGVPGTEPAPGTAAGRPVPPAWDPLGAAPFAWDLPEPSPVPPQAPQTPRPPRSKVTPITLGLALLTAGVGSAFWPALSVAQICALALGVIGVGLVVGSLVRGGRGLIGVAVPLVLLTWVLQTAPMSGFTAGDRQWNPPTAAQLQPRYELTMGSGVLDLTGTRVPNGQTLHTSVAVGVGEARVVLPRGIDAQVTCETPIGSVDCLGVTNSGIPARADQVTDNGPDGPGGGKLVLDVRSSVGSVQVQRQP